ncbi:ecotin family protein [Aeoliella mucimassa]|uniref:Ecotin n=1 Tax=Aeoliella mucimassa TaxID=2527972 RepID=A0A518AHA1_9BACT|nr:ecotin family protein [Aeoliella mucimassa]QDU54092.1 Ecotin precursor [Aeoliella mucimassa]
MLRHLGLPALSLTLLMFTACAMADDTPADEAPSTAESAKAEPAEAEKYVEKFPAPPEGMERYVILLPEKSRDEEGDFRVELIVGKNMMTDGVNRTWFGGEIRETNLEGWGFTYYEYPRWGRMAMTRMAPLPGTPQVEKFVTAPAKMIRYNSRVPVVVYVPEGGEVRYRIWSASETTEVAEQR